MDLVKFLKTLQNFQKRRLRRCFGRFAPENPKTLQLMPSGQNPAIDPPPPPQGVETIMSSSWTFKSGRIGSRASLYLRIAW